MTNCYPLCTASIPIMPAFCPLLSTLCFLPFATPFVTPFVLIGRCKEKLSSGKPPLRLEQYGLRMIRLWRLTPRPIPLIEVRAV